jgi:hypothetical protein
MRFMRVNESLSMAVVRRITLLVALAVATACSAIAQEVPSAPSTGKAAAGIDLTGYWVSVIVDDVRFHITPQKGDLAYLPLNDEGKRVAMLWDPDKDIAQGSNCKAYGAIGLMQQPGRLHITWTDDNTLRIEADSGSQTRLLHFGAAQPSGAPARLEGYSEARWEGVRTGRGVRMQAKPDSLTVITRNMTPGYLRKNGVPYSAKAVLTEYLNVLGGPEGQTYLSVTMLVDDPTYLTVPHFTTNIFKKLPDASGWDPTPCWAK